MSEPVWAQPGRPYVPSHLLPGSVRSSFAKPDEYNLQSAQPSAGSAPATAAKPASDATRLPTRSGFASRARLRSQRLPQAGNMPEDELPPTLSIRSAPETAFSPDSDAQGVPAKYSRSRLSSSTAAASSDTANTSVTVFGFPPGGSAEVLQFFGQMGEIVDNAASGDTLSDRGASDRSSLVECGRNWLRITFKDRQSAQTALAHNGHTMPGQYVIGCVLADPGELGGSLQQSSTNSLLLNDSDLSLVHEHSLAAADSSASRLDRAVDGGKEDLALNLGKIVPIELSASSHLFKPSMPKKNVPNVAEFTSTPSLPNSKENKNVLGRVVDRVADMVFGWDV